MVSIVLCPAVSEVCHVRRTSVLVLLTAPKENSCGTEHKNMPRCLSLKAIRLPRRTSMCRCHKSQQEDLPRAQAFPNGCHLSWVSGEEVSKAGQHGFDPKEGNLKAKLLLAHELQLWLRPRKSLRKLHFQFLLSAKPDLLITGWNDFGRREVIFVYWLVPWARTLLRLRLSSETVY